MKDTRALMGTRAHASHACVLDLDPCNWVLHTGKENPGPTGIDNTGYKIPVGVSSFLKEQGRSSIGDIGSLAWGEVEQIFIFMNTHTYIHIYMHTYIHTWSYLYMHNITNIICLPGNTQGFLLVLHSRITPGSAKGPYPRHWWSNLIWPCSRQTPYPLYYSYGL